MLVVKVKAKLLLSHLWTVLVTGELESEGEAISDMLNGFPSVFTREVDTRVTPILCAK